MNETIGDIAHTDSTNAWRWIALLGSLITYAGMIAYSAVHNWSLLTRGIAAEARLWAGIGVIALEITALALPLALHYWTHDAKQRIAAFVFYAVDLFLVVFNVIVDYSLTTAAVLPAWLDNYLFFVVPATPIVCGLGWSLIWLLDPGQRERAMIETMKAATRSKLADKIMESARDADLNDFAASVAQTMASDIVRATLGSAMRRAAPTNTVDRNWSAVDHTWSAPSEAVPTPGNGKHVYNAEAEAVEAPKNA